MVIGVLGVLHTLTYNRKAQVRGGQTNSANARVAQKLEELLKQSWMDPTQPNQVNPVLDPATNPHSEGPLTWTVTTEPSADGNASRLRKIVVSTSLVDANGRALASGQTVAITGFKYFDF